MKQISHSKLFLATFFLLVSVATSLIVLTPQTVLAACQERPATDSQATAQQRCVSEYIKQCKKEKGTSAGFCENLSVTEINNCAASGAGYKFKKDCLKNKRSLEKNCLDKYGGKEVTQKLSAEYNKSKCDKDKGGNCQGAYGGGKGGWVCTNPDSRQDTPEDDDTSGKGGDCKADKFTSLNKDNCGILNYVIIITNVLAGVAAIVIVIMIIVGGIQYSSAGADASKVQAAKQKITNALLALFLLVFGFSILQWLVPGGIL